MVYLRFAAMIATSTVVMFGLMYLNTYAWEHVTYSETRTYMAILMGATMAVIMLAYMLGMYGNTRLNIAIFVGSILVFGLSLWLVRSQATVGQSSYMRAMIPHHSIAIMTSERARIADPRVRKLADEIIAAQEREIAEMFYLVAALERGEGAADAGTGQDAAQPEVVPPEVVPLSEALAAPVIAELDPEPMSAAEADAALPAGPGCAFSYTSASDPVFVGRAGAGDAAAAAGVAKLNGKLIALRPETGEGARTLVEGPVMVAEGLRMAVMPLPDSLEEVSGGGRRWEADLVFELEQGLTVGYRGFYSCNL